MTIFYSKVIDITEMDKEISFVHLIHQRLQMDQTAVCITRHSVRNHSNKGSQSPSLQPNLTHGLYLI